MGYQKISMSTLNCFVGKSTYCSPRGCHWACRVSIASTARTRNTLYTRRQLVGMRTTEQNRLGSAPRRLQADIQAHITWLNERLAALDDDLDTTLRTSPV